jgi:hypothetical protein
MGRYVPVEGFSGLVRDTESNAILNLNYEEIELARERKRLAKQKRLDQQNLEQKVESLESDITEIKNMLKVLLEKK